VATEPIMMDLFLLSQNREPAHQPSGKHRHWRAIRLRFTSQRKPKIGARPSDSRCPPFAPLFHQRSRMDFRIQKFNANANQSWQRAQALCSTGASLAGNQDRRLARLQAHARNHAAQPWMVRESQGRHSWAFKLAGYRRCVRPFGSSRFPPSTRGNRI
jgi:hypothetical protein